VQFGKNNYKYQPLPIQGSLEINSRLLQATPWGTLPGWKNTIPCFRTSVCPEQLGDQSSVPHSLMLGQMGIKDSFPPLMIWSFLMLLTNCVLELNQCSNQRSVTLSGILGKIWKHFELSQLWGEGNAPGIRWVGSALQWTGLPAPPPWQIIFRPKMSTCWSWGTLS